MTISHYLPFNIDDLVAKELLDPELLFVRIERVCKDLLDGDCDDGGAVAEDSSHGHVPAPPANHSTAASSAQRAVIGLPRKLGAPWLASATVPGWKASASS